MSFSEFVSSFTDYVNTYSGLPGIIFFIVFRKQMGNISRFAFYTLLASFLADFSVQLFIRYVYPNSFIISNLWYLVNYSLLSWLYFLIIPNRKKLIGLLALIFFIGSIISFLFFFSFLESNTFIRVYTSVAFTLLAILAFLEILKHEPTKSLISYPLFWINTAIFLFSSITLFKGLFLNYIVFITKTEWEAYASVAFIGVIFNIIKNLLFFYSFILVHKGQPDYIHEPKRIQS